MKTMRRINNIQTLKGELTEKKYLENIEIFKELFVSFLMDQYVENNVEDVA